jgi:quercetin dioxygenase-like cupin family protein
MKIKETLKLNDEKPAVLLVRNTDKGNVIAIGLKRNQVLKKHITTIPALLIVLEGLISFEMEGIITEISPLGTIEIPVNTPHEVAGIQESIFLVVKEK